MTETPTWELSDSYVHEVASNGRRCVARQPTPGYRTVDIVESMLPTSMARLRATAPRTVA
jgi:hypothetical protein